MAKVLTAISRDSPASPLSVSVNDTFSFAGTPTLSGGGGVQRYDFRWEVDPGSGFVPISGSTGLTTANTNPLVNTNSQAQNAITVTCAQAGSYTIRMAGAPTSGGSYTVFSPTQTVSVAEAAVSITPDSSTHSHTASGPTVAAKSAVVTASSAHAHSATSPTISEGAAVEPDNAVHGHLAGSPTLAAKSVVAANDNAIGLVSTAPTVTFVPLLAVNSAWHAHSASQPSSSPPSNGKKRRIGLRPGIKTLGRL
jgi:hypothetical protein